MYAITHANSRLGIRAGRLREGHSRQHGRVRPESNAVAGNAEEQTVSNLSLGGDRGADLDKISEQELAGLIAAHAVWLSSNGRNGAKFDKPGANFSYGGFLAADLRFANLPGVCLFNANLRESNFAHASLVKANLKGASMVNMNLGDAVLAEANLHKAVSPGANFENADLNGAHLQTTNFSSANFTRTQLRGADLRDANLAGATFRESALDDANLTDAKLMMVDFSGASLSGAALTRAVLFGAILERVDLSDADLSSAQGLTLEQLETAYGNPRTRLPAAFAAYVLQRGPTGHKGR